MFKFSVVLALLAIILETTCAVDGTTLLSVIVVTDMEESTFCMLICLTVAVFGEPSTGDLQSVVVLYRHGDRAPIRPYKNDPYGEESWPLGFGQLTNIGKKRQYALGKWLRTRYIDFLPSSYNRRDIKIQSSNVDRCLMSAQLNLAGLYPPEGKQIWNEDLKWQPIPIHTVPEIEDNILAQSKPCSKYDVLFQQALRQKPFNETLAHYKEQMESFSAASGDDISTLEQLMDLYNTVYIENLYNLTLPDWTKSLLTEDIEKVCAEAWTSYAYTPDLARLRSGPLVNLILSHFEDVRDHVADTPKFFMLSGHDSTVAPLLTAMEVYDNKWPDYASSLLFEMREDEGKAFVNIFYKNNSTEVANLTLPGCDFDCELEKFVEILTPVRVDSENWDKECQAATTS